MSTADLIMDYSSITSLAKQVTEAQQEFEELLGNLDALVENINGSWKGKSQVEFAASYSKLKPKLKRISGVLESYASALTSTVTKESELENNQAKMCTLIDIPSF